MNNPLGEWAESKGDHNLDFIIDAEDFDAIQKIVDVSFAADKQLEQESWIDYRNRLKERYIKAASEKGFEMLGRIWDWLDDAVYLSSEVSQLRDECLKVKKETENSGEIIALDKIIVACDEALNLDSGIFFGCD